MRMLRGDAAQPPAAAMGAAIVPGQDPGMQALEIDCARWDERGHVTHVGGPGASGRRWLLPLPVVVAALERGDARYFVSCGWQQLGLRVKDGELVTMVEHDWSVRSLRVCSDPS